MPGESRLIVAVIGIVALGFAALALVTNLLELAGALLLVGVGQGLAGPSISGLLSRITPQGEQGAVFGTLSSAQTVARMISYLVANLLLGRVSAAAPFWFGLGVYVVAGLAAVRFLSQLGGDFPREQAQATEAQAVAAHGAAE